MRSALGHARSSWGRRYGRKQVVDVHAAHEVVKAGGRCVSRFDDAAARGDSTTGNPPDLCAAVDQRCGAHVQSLRVARARSHPASPGLRPRSWRPSAPSRCRARGGAGWEDPLGEGARSAGPGRGRGARQGGRGRSSSKAKGCAAITVFLPDRKASDTAPRRRSQRGRGQGLTDDRETGDRAGGLPDGLATAGAREDRWRDSTQTDSTGPAPGDGYEASSAIQDRLAEWPLIPPTYDAESAASPDQVFPPWDRAQQEVERLAREPLLAPCALRTRGFLRPELADRVTEWFTGRPGAPEAVRRSYGRSSARPRGCSRSFAARRPRGVRVRYVRGESDPYGSAAELCADLREHGSMTRGRSRATNRIRCSAARKAASSTSFESYTTSSATRRSGSGSTCSPSSPRGCSAGRCSPEPRARRVLRARRGGDDVRHDRREAGAARGPPADGSLRGMRGRRRPDGQISRVQRLGRS